MMRQDLKSGLWLPDWPRLCSMFPAVHGVAGAAAGGGGPAQVQKKTNSVVEANDVTTTYDSTPTNGNLGIALYSHFEGGNRTLTAPSGWSTAFDVEFSWSTVEVRLACFYKVFGESEGSDVFVDISAGGASVVFLHIEEWSGMAASSPLDVSQTNDETASDGLTADTGTTAATAQASAVAFAVCNFADDDFDVPDSADWSDSYTQEVTSVLLSSGLACTFSTARKILSATGTQNTTLTMTGATGEQRWSGIAVFKGA